MLNFLRLAGAALVLAAAPAAFAQTTLLDGRAFLADAGIKGKAADEKDVITFAGGRIHSSACDPYGYDKGEYKAVKVGDAIEFEAVTNSEKYGRNVWKGTVRGGEIEGTFVHHQKGWLLNPNPAPIEHWFKGKAQG